MTGIKTASGERERIGAGSRTAMKNLQIIWERLVDDGGQTCPRCRGTGEEIVEAVRRLNAILGPKGITPTLEIREIDQAAFRVRPLDSNRILVAGKPLESWLGAKAGQSRCCEQCGDQDCRTVELAGQRYEVVPAELLVQAGIAAAAAPDAAAPSCCSGSRCC